MEIRGILPGKTTGFAVYPAQWTEENEAANYHPTSDRVEQSRRWIAQMEDQRKQLLMLLSQPTQDEGKKSDGILDILDGADKEKEELDALSQNLKIQMKCVEIARRIMQGKKVPPKDELYLMEHDPKGYKLAMALRKPPKKNEKECKSVLDDEDEQSSTSSDSGETAPAEVESGELSVSAGEETAK